MKKLFVLLVSLFILSGCEAVYNINIDDSFNEEIKIYPKTTQEADGLSKTTYQNPAYYDPDHGEDEMGERTDIERYTVTFSNNVYTSSYKFIDKYEKSNFANSFTKRFTYFSDTNANIYANDFSRAFNTYSGLSKITVNIITTKEVSAHNADYVNGNTYSWIITRDNPKKEIRFYFVNKTGNGGTVNPTPTPTPSPINNDDKKDINQNKDSSLKSGNKMLLYVLYTLFFGLIFVIIIFRKKIK